MTARLATYRLQFRNGITFDRALEIVPYLKQLGVSHLYASPIFTAVAGSTHGYDLVDHNEIEPAIGGRAGFERLSEGLRAAELGLILDIVPNHMAASLENRWWRSVVEWGQESPHGYHFDLDWTKKLTLPILGRPYREVLRDGELRLRLDPERGNLTLAFFDNLLPLSPPTYATVLEKVDDHSLAPALAERAAAADPRAENELHETIKGLLSDTEAAASLQARLDALSADRELIDALHRQQPWQLLHFLEARRTLSYRRFFEVTGLVGLRVEDEEVFEDSHRLVLELVRSGKVDGLRIDHIDGLADPTGYLDRLREEVGPDVYLIVEKILEGDEALPRAWPVAGTTGYEFIAAMAALLTDVDGLAALGRFYGECRDRPVALEAERREAKTQMVTHNFEGEVSSLVSLLMTIAADSGEDGAVTEADLKTALRAIIVAFPVYRTYGNREGLPATDRLLLDRAAETARGNAPDITDAAVSHILAVLNGQVARRAFDDALEFRMRFQQLTGPIMAKAVEDTLFYRYNRLIALNEVGGDPAAPRGGIDGFHATMAERVRLQPEGLLATATHDTKRGEDARARLYTISEAPETWSEAVTRWRAMHRDLVRALNDGPAPEPDTEWLLYQGLAGVWPEALEPDDGRALNTLTERFLGYVEKVLREAELRTSWMERNEPHEEAVRAYAARLLAPDNRDFREDFAATLQPFIRAGAVNSLTQTLIKMAAPGIPDIYQGSEDRDFSLVDPDNRRPVDFAMLADRLEDSPPAAFDDGSETLGAVKQHLIRRCLALRAELPDLFTSGEYEPVAVTGAKADHVVAFVRRGHDRLAVAIAPRLPFALLDAGGGLVGDAAWGDTALSLPAPPNGGRFTDILSGETFEGGQTVPLAQLLRDLPVALLA